jgi:hypothetical protein
MNILFAGVVGLGTYLLAKKAGIGTGAPEPQTPTSAGDDIRAREGGLEGAQPDQAGQPVRTVEVVGKHASPTPAGTVTVAPKTGSTSSKPQTRAPDQATAAPPPISPRTERMVAPHPVTTGGCCSSMEIQRAANRLTFSGLAGDLRF